MGLVVLPEHPLDEWDLSEWLELVAAEKPGGQGVHSHQQSEESLVIRIRDNQRRSAMRQLLGWAWADDGPPYQLHREACAAQHPTFPWLWADSLGVGPRNPLPGLQLDLTTKAKRPGVGWFGYAPTDTSRYAWSEVLVRFRNIWWRQFTDLDPVWQRNYVGKEWMRSVATVNKSAQLDLISAEGAGDQASLHWAEGTAGAPPTGGNVDSAFNGTQYVRVQKTGFKLVWKCVPINYTCGEVNFAEANIASFLLPFPERLVKALGCVNDSPFPGSASPYRAGTLMLTALEEQPYQLPVRTEEEFGLIAADYTLTFEYFDPDRDPSAVTNPVASTVKYGHHLYPYRPSGRYWYYATSGPNRGTYNGNAVLKSIDFHTLFRHRSDIGNFPIP